MIFQNQDQEIGKKISIPDALGQSEAFIEFQEQISKVAPIERPVLILGERGTGKELAASRIHFLSKRWQKSLITLNCSALTPALIGSELFGLKKEHLQVQCPGSKVDLKKHPRALFFSMRSEQFPWKCRKKF